MGVFYTGKGDKGKSYVGKKSVSKTCLEIEALGQLDELNSMLGVLKSLPAGRHGQKVSSELKTVLHQVQENLFTIQSHVAAIMLQGEGSRRGTSAGIASDSKFKVPEFKVHKVEEIEKIIDEIEQRLPPLKKFIISGTNPTSAWLDLMRAKSRNVERSVLKIKKVEKLNQDIRSYLNRLSSLFFALARWEARNKKERSPSYK